MIHRTFRSLDEPPKLVGFTPRQWVALLADTAAVLGVVHLTHLAAKPAITLCVFLIGLPGALSYVSESGGLQLGALLGDMCRWRFSRKSLAAVPAGFSSARGLVILAPVQHGASMSGEGTEELVAGAPVSVDGLLDRERGRR